MTLQQLRYVITVAQKGTISEAAIRDYRIRSRFHESGGKGTFYFTAEPHQCNP